LAVVENRRRPTQVQTRSCRKTTTVIDERR